MENIIQGPTFLFFIFYYFVSCNIIIKQMIRLLFFIGLGCKYRKKANQIFCFLQICFMSVCCSLRNFSFFFHAQNTLKFYKLLWLLLKVTDSVENRQKIIFSDWKSQPVSQFVFTLFYLNYWKEIILHAYW